MDASGPPDVVSNTEGVIRKEPRTGKTDGRPPEPTRGWIHADDAASHSDDRPGRQRDETEQTMIDVERARQPCIRAVAADVVGDRNDVVADATMPRPRFKGKMTANAETCASLHAYLPIAHASDTIERGGTAAHEPPCSIHSGRMTCDATPDRRTGVPGHPVAVYVDEGGAPAS